MRKLGLLRDVDLALHLPLRYEDETRLQPIQGLREGQTVHVQGKVQTARVEPRSRRALLVHLSDGHGDLVLRFLHFHAGQAKSLAPGTLVRARGEVRRGPHGLELVHPAFRIVTPETPLARELTPVYPTGAALPQAYLRKAIDAALKRVRLPELLPPEAVDAHWPSLHEALQQLHHPAAGTPLARLDDRSHPAWQRLKFEELLAQQLAQGLARRERAARPSPRLRTADASTPSDATVVARLRAALPFALTCAQERVSTEIAADLARGQPMHRLLQGDVGAGKTVVAALAAALTIDAGFQCALMAPTEILAEQHFARLVEWLRPLGVDVAWLTGRIQGKARREALARVADGRAQLVVGTHAVIQDKVDFARLGLAVVDEQHRFGVAQRLALRYKLGAQGLEPHLLMMSATPIPRTLAMSMLADLDVSTLDELPPGRLPILTRLVDARRRAEVIDRVRRELARGSQVYWVCPLIEASEALDLRHASETLTLLRSALPEVCIELLHGRMSAADKKAAMVGFSTGRVQVLVATTVIEVGVDVPNARLVVVEHAERFGLSQLHQLRGRVGRGHQASACVLLYAPPLSEEGKARLRAMVETNDGFEIARRDLTIRGPGEFLGARQSGLPWLRFADLSVDAGLLERARAAADRLLSHDREAAHAQVERWLGGREDYLSA